MRRLRRLIRVLLIGCPLALAACKQGVNERCQVDSDCQDGLGCVFPAGGTPQTGGTCQPRGGFDMATPAPVDMTTVDALESDM